MAWHEIISEIEAAPKPVSLCEVADDDCCRECLKELQTARHFEVAAALQQHQPEFGLRFLLAVVYVARREASEGQIWRAVRAEIQLTDSIAEIMFLGNGQPRPELKALLEKCCRHYRLRHIFGDEGAQEWFGSIYLQFGFTQRGFSARLPEWLMGYSQPTTISRLLEDQRLQSESFRKLWDGLLSFRRGNSLESQARSIIFKSPWVLPEWADDLLLAAKKKPHLSPAAPRTGVAGEENAPRTFLSEPRLIVENHLADALWRIELEGLADLGLAGNSYRVTLVCGEMPSRETFLRKQADGSFSNLNQTFDFPFSLVRQERITASITDEQGREVAAQDVRLFDPEDDIIAFNERGYLVNDFVTKGPRTNVTYHLLLRDDLTMVPPASDWYLHKKLGYALSRLRLDDGQTLRVFFDDNDELWSSVTRLLKNRGYLPDGLAPRCEMSAVENPSLYGPTIKEITLRVLGIDGAALVSARWRSQGLRIEAPDIALQLPWRIAGIQKPEAILAQRVAIQVTLRISEAIYRTEVEWIPSCVGIFEQSRGRTTFGETFNARNYEQLKRGRYTLLPEPLTDGQRQRGLRWCIFEGDRFVSPLREGVAQPFTTLGAYGQSLSVRRGQFNCEGTPTIVIGEIADQGLFQIYGDKNPFLGEDYTFDTWGSPELGAEHQLFHGLMHEKATKEIAGERLIFADDKAMFSPFPAENCDYLVLAYAGVRLATWWRVLKHGDDNSWSSNLAQIRDDQDARRAAFTIRWAKLPILSGDYYHDVKAFFRRFPHVVLREWLFGHKERSDGRKIEGENTEAWHDAVRAIIQGYQSGHNELSVEAKLKLLQCLGNNEAGDANAKVLDTFRFVGECDPVLMGRMIQYWLTTNPAPVVKGMMRGALLNDIETEDQMMKDLVYATQGTDESFLNGILMIGVKAVSDPALGDRDKANLKSALTLAPFRQLLCLRIVTQWLPTNMPK